ncbi:MAG: DUF1566 domain-containing protein, partial [Archangium sp.]|nr:DUF1566 domain-containing protein [Archangium sp.]
LDRVTGLTWQRAARSGVTWAGARNTCTTLAEVDGGWRVPGVKELTSLIDPRSTPAIDGTAFPEASSELYWASTLRDGGVGYMVGFHAGDVQRHSTGALGSVRCVR